MSEKITLTPKILELNQEGNDIFMTMDICILSNDVNYNNAKFTEDYIQGIIDNKNTYIGLPFLASRLKLENGVYDKLTHEFDGKKLNTDSIGSFVDYWSDTIDDALCLMGQVKIYKRYENTCKAIVELYNDGELETSCEVLINAYESLEDGVRTISYNEGKNPFIGSAIVTTGAEKRAKPRLLIAEAFNKDLTNLSEKGDVTLEEKHFNKGIEINYHGKVETNSLKFSEISNQIYNLLNPINPKTNYRSYNYYILDMYNDHLIVEEEDDYVTLWRIGYTISNDIVTLDPQDTWVKGTKKFVPDGIDIDQLIADLKQKEIELNNKIKEVEKGAKLQMEKTVEELQTELSSKETEITKLTDKVAELEGKVGELNELVVSQETAKKEMESTIAELNSQVEGLTPFKEQVEKAEKEAKVAELSAKYSKLLSKETFESERVQTALDTLDTVELNSVIVEEVSKEKVVKEVELNSKSDDVVVTATKSQDLIPQDIASKYGLSI